MQVIIRDQQVQDLMKKLKNLVPSMKPALQDCGDYLQASIFKNFSAGGRPNAWAGLQPMTKRIRMKRGTYPFGSNQGILREFGTYIASIKPTVRTSSVAVGTSDSRALILNNGGRNSSGRFVVGREHIMYQDPEDVNKCMEVLSDHIKHELGIP